MKFVPPPNHLAAPAPKYYVHQQSAPDPFPKRPWSINTGKELIGISAAGGKRAPGETGNIFYAF